ncbi:MAG TPA: V-type ATP synthase subunit A, partial [Rikenellaceae bacterium]|nr:V-type ATP synthase subunit A [Rikenellaceae bacterium]
MQTQTTGKVRGIIANLITIEVDGPVAQNEICFIHLGDTRLMAEVIKVAGKNAQAQVYESTRGLRVGDHVTFEGHMLEVNLGPGLLSSNYDGLQNNLATMEGVFLKRGEYTEPIDREKKWDFIPLLKKGDTVTAGDWLGQVMEGWMVHRIMVPFMMTD